MHIRRWAFSLINLTRELFAGMNLTWELLADIDLTWELFAGITLAWEIFAGINLTWELFAGYVSDMYSPLSRLEWYSDLVVHFTETNYTNTLQEWKQSGGWCDISHKDNWCYLTNKYYDFFWLLFCIRSQHTCFSFCFQHCQICMTATTACSTFLFVYVSVLMFWWLFWKKEEEKKGFLPDVFCLFLI